MAWRRVTLEADSDTAEQRCLNIRAAHTELRRIVRQCVLSTHLLYITKTLIYINCIGFFLYKPSAHSAGTEKADEHIPTHL